MSIESHWVQAGGTRLHYLCAGHSGPPVILLHGGGTDSAALSWRLALEPLAAQFRVFAPDWPGYGQSEPPARPYTTPDYIALLDAFRGALGLEQASVVGLSLGGSVALGYALQAPQRVERLVLVDSYGLHDRAPSHRLSYLVLRLPLVNALTWALLRRSRAMTRAALQNIFYDPKAVSEALVDEVGAAVRQPHAGQAFAAWQLSEVQWGGLRTVYRERLGELRAPTLIVHGAQDKLVPLASAEAAARRIPDAHLAVVPNCGHWPQREQPALFNQLVADFLSAATPPPAR